MTSGALKMSELQLHEIHFIEDSDDEVFLARMLLDGQNVDQVIVHHTDLDSFCKTVQTTNATGPIIVLVDLNLPGMKGDEVVKRIYRSCKREKMFAGICTGSEDPADVQRAKEVGAQFYVSKPLNLQCLEKICDANAAFKINKTSPDKVGIFVNIERYLNSQHCTN